MKRFIIISALCLPVAGLATTMDLTPDPMIETIRITVPASDLAECEQTLRDLRQRPVVTDDGWTLPFFMRDDDLPRSVCAAEA